LALEVEELETMISIDTAAEICNTHDLEDGIYNPKPETAATWFLLAAKWDIAMTEG